VIGVETHPAIGRCEVVVFSQNPDLSLWQLPTDHIALILAVLAERSGTMAEAGMKYVLPFENRGAEMGVTLHHPHGQIYGYGFVPAIQARAAEQLRHHRGTHGHDLVSWLANQELRLQIRVVTQRNHALAFVPPFARFPREVWVVPLRARADLRSLTADERLDVAAVLGETLARLDGLWGKPMPYLLTFNQAPSDGEDHEEWTLRIEIWPLRRAADKLKYLAGTELGTGVFASDVLPEDAAADLRAVALPPSPDVISRCS
jgi:UDPglucose--hexose-1-phosphate uridylyltransferase